MKECIDANLCSCMRNESLKNFRLPLYRIRIVDTCDNGAVLYQLS